MIIKVEMHFHIFWILDMSKKISLNSQCILRFMVKTKQKIGGKIVK